MPNWYDGTRYRIESTESSWAGPWQSLQAAMGQMGRLTGDGYVVVAENGVVVASKRHGLMIPVADFQQRRKAKA